MVSEYLMNRINLPIWQNKCQKVYPDTTPANYNISTMSEFHSAKESKSTGELEKRCPDWEKMIIMPRIHL